MRVETDRQGEEENLGSKQNSRMSKSSLNFGVTLGAAAAPGHRLLLPGRALQCRTQGCELFPSCFSLWDHGQLTSLSEPPGCLVFAMGPVTPTSQVG